MIGIYIFFLACLYSIYSTVNVKNCTLFDFILILCSSVEHFSYYQQIPLKNQDQQQLSVNQ